MTRTTAALALTFIAHVSISHASPASLEVRESSRAEVDLTTREANSRLSPEQRIDHARVVLGLSRLGRARRSEILRAHEAEGIAEKARILESFTPDQRRLLMAHNLVGKRAEPTVRLGWAIGPVVPKTKAPEGIPLYGHSPYEARPAADPFANYHYAEPPGRSADSHYGSGASNNSPSSSSTAGSIYGQGQLR